MKKKSVLFAFLAIIVMAVTPTSLHADTEVDMVQDVVVESYMDAAIQPRLTYIWDARNKLEITKLGEVTTSSHLVGSPSQVTRCEITAVLERMINGKWTYYMSWSGAKDSYSLDLVSTHYLVRGTYRVVTTATVYAGSQSETVVIQGAAVVH